MNKINILISLFIAVLLLSSCREIKVDTIVNKDGSFTRIVTITGDSSDVFKSGLPYPIDLSWEMDFHKDTTSEKEYILTYTKTYNSDASLNKELDDDTSWRENLARKIEIKKNFGFFYSYIVYKETIGAANPFTLLNYKDYLSNEDMLWLTGKKLALNSLDSANIKQADDKAEEYLQESLTEEIIAILKSGVEKLNNPTLNVGLIDKYRDSIAEKVGDWGFNNTDEFVGYLAKLANNTEIFKINEIAQTQFKSLDKKGELLLKIFEMEDYTVSAELPGLIASTNSLSIKGNKVQWNVNTMSFLFEDYSMIAESRVINIWMFIITGIVILALVVTTIIKSGKI